jgi:HK97 family phage major capsid protein
MDEKTMEKTVDQINKGIEQLQEDIGKKADVDNLEKKYGELQEQLEKVSEQEYFQKQQEQLDQISSDLMDLSQKQSKGMTVSDEMEKSFNNDEYRKAIKEAGGKAGQIWKMDLKSITTSDINSGTIRDTEEPGVARHPWRENPIWNSIQKGVIGEGRDQVSWWEEATRTDNATMEGETDYGSQSAKTWTKQTLDIKMIKDFTKISRSSLEDWEYARSEVLDLLNNGIPRKREGQTLDGTGVGENLTGIITQAKAFSKPANFDTVSDPNEIDAIRAIMTQIMNGDTSDANKKGYIPNILAVNPGTLMQMRSIKDQNGSYVIPPLGDGFTNIDGVQVVPSLDLDADEFLMGDFTKAKAYIKRNMRVSFHYENEDDVLNDLVLVLASMRLAGIKIATPHKFAFVTGTFSNVIEQIREPIG